MSNDNNKVFHECGAGWNSIIDPLVARSESNGYIVDQIKEKFGGLRFYYTPGPIDDIEFEDMVDAAEAASKGMCEMCGKVGRLMIKGGWYKVLCPDDAINLGYKVKA